MVLIDNRGGVAHLVKVQSVTYFLQIVPISAVVGTELLPFAIAKTLIRPHPDKFRQCYSNSKPKVKRTFLGLFRLSLSLFLPRLSKRISLLPIQQHKGTASTFQVKVPAVPSFFVVPSAHSPQKCTRSPTKKKGHLPMKMSPCAQSLQIIEPSWMTCIRFWSLWNGIKNGFDR